MSRGPAVLLVAVALLLVAASIVVVLGDRREPNAPEFQRLVGGLGGGPAIDLSRCAYGFDPRLEADCGQDVGPAPAGKTFCACHGCTVAIGPLAP